MPAVASSRDGAWPIRARGLQRRSFAQLNRRKCVDMDVASRMLSENFDGAPFVLGIPSPHPQQQASTIHLLLQIMRVVIADPFGED